MLCFHSHSISHFRANIHPKAMSGHSRSPCGRFCRCAAQGPLLSSQVNRSSRTAITGIKTMDCNVTYQDHRIARGRSTTWWGNVGNAMTSTGHAFPKSIFSCKGKTLVISQVADRRTKNSSFKVYSEKFSKFLVNVIYTYIPILILCESVFYSAIFQNTIYYIFNIYIYVNINIQKCIFIFINILELK